MTSATKRAATYLLVEDDDSHAYIIQRCFQLETTSCRLSRVKSGEECLAYLDAEEPYADRSRFPYPDVVILDIRMEDCNGLDLLQEIRNANSSLPIILNTAYDSYREDVKSVAADCYVVKSYDLSELKAKLAELVKAESSA